VKLFVGVSIAFISLLRSATDFVLDIWRHDHDESQIYDNDDDKPLSYDVEQLRPPPPPTDKVTTTETPDPSTLDTPPINPIETTNPPNNKFETPPTAPPTPTEEKDTCFPDLQALVAKTQSQPQSQTHPSAQTSTITTHPPAQTSTTTTHHPPASHPRYQNQTLTSALRATPKSPKARSRQRSVTFDLKGEGVKSCKRESSVVREKVRGSQEGEKSTTIDGGEVGQEEEEERLSSSVSSSSIKEDGFEDGSLTRSGGELGAGSE
jgi:hypothetical protein